MSLSEGRYSVCECSPVTWSLKFQSCEGEIWRFHHLLSRTYETTRTGIGGRRGVHTGRNYSKDFHNWRKVSNWEPIRCHAEWIIIKNMLAYMSEYFRGINLSNFVWFWFTLELFMFLWLGGFKWYKTVFILEKRLLTAREANWNECLSNDQLNWSF